MVVRFQQYVDILHCAGALGHVIATPTPISFVVATV
jgi:hypothetical protein